MNNSFTAFRSLSGSTIAMAGLATEDGAAEPICDLIVLRPAEIGPGVDELTVKKYRKHRLSDRFFASWGISVPGWLRLFALPG